MFYICLQRILMLAMWIMIPSSSVTNLCKWQSVLYGIGKGNIYTHICTHTHIYLYIIDIVSMFGLQLLKTIFLGSFLHPHNT